MALEEKYVCSAVFLDVPQAFDKVNHTELLIKLRIQLPEVIESLLRNR